MSSQMLISHADTDSFGRMDFWNIASESEEIVKSSPEGGLTP